MKVTHLTGRYQMKRPTTWCGRGVSSPIPTTMLITNSVKKANCLVCLGARANNLKARK